MSGVFGIMSVYNAWFNPTQYNGKAFMYFVLNRIFDGVDGTYARMTNQSTDFGGYLDILVDFTIYGLVPLGVTAGNPSEDRFIFLVILEVSFFVNAGGLFMLSALIEKNKNNEKMKYRKDDKKNEDE